MIWKRATANRTVAVALGASCLFGQAVAQTDSTNFELSAGAATEYMYRGAAQSQGPQVWIGAESFWEGGFYAGVWASNVNFESDEAYAEYDLYMGYQRDFGDHSLDVSVTRYDYLGAPSNDSYEFYNLKVAVRRRWTTGWIGISGTISPDGPSIYREMEAVELTGGYRLTPRLTISGGAGVQQIAAVPLDYSWWHIGALYQISQHFKVEVRLWDNDFQTSDEAYRPRVVIGVSAELFP